MIRNYSKDKLNIADEKGIEIALNMLQYIRKKLYNFRKKPAIYTTLKPLPQKVLPIDLPKKTKTIYKYYSGRTK